METTDTLSIIKILTSSLAVFFFATKLMSERLQKVAGSKIQSVWNTLTGHPPEGILTGMGITAVILPSSTSTVTVVSLDNEAIDDSRKHNHTPLNNTTK